MKNCLFARFATRILFCFCFVLFFTVPKRSCSMDNVNCAVEQTCPVQSLRLCGQVEHRLYQFTSTVVRAYFARQMTWNNPERIAERRRNVFGHLATFRRRLFLVPSLVSNSINWLIKHQSSGYVVQKPGIVVVVVALPNRSFNLF